MPWVVASLLAATSAFGQSQANCKSPQKVGQMETPQKPMVSAYNAPAEINIGMQGDRDVFGSASFLYWQPSLDNMSFAAASTVDPSIYSFNTNGVLGASFVEIDFKYQPGFKVGLGLTLQTDNWDTYSEYTRVHGKHTASSNGLFNSPSLYPTLAPPDIVPPVLTQIFLFNNAAVSYRNNLDFVDVETGRKYYVGNSLIFRSGFGLRGAWILQNFHASYSTPGAVVSVSSRPVTVVANVDVYARTHSWGVGPRTGLTMDWLLGYGFRFFGSGYTDLLYSKYKIQYKLTGLALAPAVALSETAYATTYQKTSGLRTHLDLEMGFGWGSYFDNNNWHVDFSAAYGFQAFFNQNMFPTYNAPAVINTATPGDLYVQGLTLTARLDF
jgi:hypothetical protein